MIARHPRILEQLRLHGEVSVHELAETLKVSPITIRRDLEALGRDGLLTRTHGGAVFSRSAVVEFAFLERAHNRVTQKTAIARHMATVIRPGMTIVIDTGTTTLEVARAIANIPRLRVLTNSLAIASALRAYDNIDLVLLGGNVRDRSPDLDGPLTEGNLEQFQTDLAIIGADAVSRDGLYTSDMGIARISSVMIARALETWLVVDSGKFTRRSFVKFADWSSISHVVTDDELAESYRDWLGTYGCDLHIVSA